MVSTTYIGIPRSQTVYLFFFHTQLNVLLRESVASEDPSTPRTESLPGMRRTRKRRDTYYRLPLCRTYGVDSIHARSACSITAHVPSRGWRGLLLSNPARRPRSFRSRTISHSYEKSEVTNASYENFQASDNDSISSFSHPLDTRNLHEELRGSSLQSVSTVGNTTSTPLKPLSGQHARSEISQAELVSDDRRVLMLSSLRLSLPRPFSAAPRSSSLNAAALFVADVDQRPFQPRSVSTPRSHELAELPDIMGATLSKSYGEEGLRALVRLLGPSSVFSTAKCNAVRWFSFRMENSNFSACSSTSLSISDTSLVGRIKSSNSESIERLSRIWRTSIVVEHDPSKGMEHL